jgi:lysophospholipase L1-like esterase
MTAVLVTVLLVLLVSAGLFVLLVRRMNALPPNTPRRFLDEKQRQPGKKVVACLGASITQGQLSFSWVNLLAERVATWGVQVVNAGVNGDLAYNARQRLPEVIACQPDAVVVLVGTNDILAATSPEAEARYRKEKQLPAKPTREWYREHLEGIVTELRGRTQARVALCSLPMLGEKLDSPVNQQVRAYNDVIRQVARDNALMYLPIYEDLTRYLQQERGANGREFQLSTGLVFKAAAQHHLLRKDWDRVAEANGFFLCTDGIHLDRRAGERVADLVQAFLLAQGMMPEPEPQATA